MLLEQPRSLLGQRARSVERSRSSLESTDASLPQIACCGRPEPSLLRRSLLPVPAFRTVSVVTPGLASAGDSAGPRWRRSLGVGWQAGLLTAPINVGVPGGRG